ncbi:MAG: hypothetical protein AAGA67_01850 [Cyanobacteria bacterium P01_F01_bin.153]
MSLQGLIMGHHFNSRLAKLVIAAGFITVPAIPTQALAGNTLGIITNQDVSETPAIRKASLRQQCQRLTGTLDNIGLTFNRFPEPRLNVRELNGQASVFAQMSQQVSQLRLADATLRKFQDGFAQVFKTLEQASRKKAKAVEDFQNSTQNLPPSREGLNVRLGAQDQLRAQVAEANKVSREARAKKQSLHDETNDYCGS